MLARLTLPRYAKALLQLPRAWPLILQSSGIAFASGSNLGKLELGLKLELCHLANKLSQVVWSAPNSLNRLCGV